MEKFNTESQEIDRHKKLEHFFEPENDHQKICPVRDIMDRFGDKWSLLVILNLGHSGKTRFNELRSKIEGISQRMLTVTLRSLERDGLITRQIFAEVPPRVDYELTHLGNGLLQQISNLAEWTSGNMDDILRSRSEYDSRNL
jgi:DNA-binding HxlR family transcriptional regulator